MNPIENNLGKRKAFGFVNDSRMNLISKSGRSKILKS